MTTSAPDPEREPTPERKWWNIFERQSSPEREKELEFEQLERAKVLKSAAKERGHFWESFLPSREENPPDDEVLAAPKGEKVRKKWRRLIFRKSEKQIEEFKEEQPETIDSYTLAQLMIAERVILLQHQLQESEPKTRERRSIKTELDVLGLLSEKLSDPEIEVPEEIEETFRVIVEMTDEADEPVDVEGEELPQIEEGDSKEIDDTLETDRESSFKRYGAAVIVALKRAIPGQPTTGAGTQPTQPDPHRKTSPTTATIVTKPISSGGRLRPISTPSPTIPILLHRDTKPSQPETHGEAAPALALTAAVVLAEQAERNDDVNEAMRLSLRPPDTPRVDISRTELEKTPTATQDKQPSKVTTERTLDEIHEVADEAPSGTRKKFDHMTTLELLLLARSVSIGHGEYLERAYRSDKIDRAGLISVLKTLGRGGNYREDYRIRSAEYLRLKLESQTQESRPVPEDRKFKFIPKYYNRKQTNRSVTTIKIQTPPQTTKQASVLTPTRATIVMVFIMLASLVALLLMN